MKTIAEVKRRKIAEIYYEKLNSLEKEGILNLPPKFSTNSSSESTFQNYEIKVKSREKLMHFLRSKNISTIKQWGGYSIAHFEKLGFDINDYPATAELFDRLLLLPMNHLMSEGDANYVAESIISYYKN